MRPGRLRAFAFCENQGNGADKGQNSQWSNKRHGNQTDRYAKSGITRAMGQQVNRTANQQAVERNNERFKEGIAYIQIFDGAEGGEVTNL